MLGASGAMLQAGESAAGAVAGSVGASSVEGAQAATSGGGVSAIMGEIGDEDCKGRAGDSGGDELGSGGDRGFLGGGSGGNRWPRQETLALLKIRSDMDVVFRDSSLKGPLWEEVARKMADLGYHRSAKKCKEKFENVYKYHKRTKEGRAAKSDGKTYRFFDQLQALETHSMLPPPPALPPPPRPPPPVQAAVPISMAMPPPIQPPSVITTVPAHITVTSTNPVPVSISNVGQQSQPSVQPAIPATISHIPQPQQVTMQNVNALSFPSSPSDTPSSSSTSSTSSDEEIHGVRRKRKRKWKDFFERLMKRVIGKQEDLQRKFLEAIEKREQDRMVREEAWKVQEMARLNREHEILVQERSMAAAKDAALISFLQKLSNQQQIPIPIPPPVIQPVSQPHPQPRTQTPIHTPPPAPVQLPQVQELKTSNAAAIVQVPAATQQLEVSPVPTRMNNGDPSGSYSPATASSSRWPKTEVEALINLRTILDQKYQETGPKGPLWEEISSEMKKLGYNRNAKRCKEKWENINKYFKKVKESNKKRPEDSKTCPYFHQLDALYRQKNKVDQGFGGYAAAKSHQPAAIAPVAAGVEAMAAPIMVQPEQQWPLQTDHNMEQDRDEEDDDEDEEEDEDDQGEGYEIVANSNNATSMGGAAAATAASS